MPRGPGASLSVEPRAQDTFFHHLNAGDLTGVVLARAHDGWRGPLGTHARQDGGHCNVAALSRQAPWGPSVQECRDPLNLGTPRRVE